MLVVLADNPKDLYFDLCKRSIAYDFSHNSKRIPSKSGAASFAVNKSWVMQSNGSEHPQDSFEGQKRSPHKWLYHFK